MPWVDLQPIIEAAQHNAAEAKAEFHNLRELQEVQEALESGSNSLAWLMNTSEYQRWLGGEEENEYIWYRITDNSALYGHQNVVAALCHHFLQQYDTVHSICDIFYVRFSGTKGIHEAESSITAARLVQLEDIFANLVSQVLVTYDDMRKSILSFPRPYRNLLRQLFNKTQSIGNEDLVDLLLACLRQTDGLDEMQVKTRKPKIIVLENVENSVQITASKLAFKVARLSENTRLLVSSKSGDVGEIESWRGHKIDESTECTGRLVIPYQSVRLLICCQECLESLRFEAMFARREQVVYAESGTNEWIWSYAPYVEWTREASGILWIQGKPGSGKSVLAKTILGRLRATSDTQPWIIADWFYNARGGERSTSHIFMLRAILFQILDQDRSLFTYYQDAYRSPRWLDRLSDVLLRIAGGGADIPSVMCVIDAMDESRDESMSKPVDLHSFPKTLENMLDLLQDIINIPGSSIKLLILSRPNRSIEKYLRYYHKVALEYANTRDIEIVVDAGIRTLTKAIAVFDSSDEEGQSKSLCRRQRSKPHHNDLSLSKVSSSAKKASSSRIFKKSRESEEEEISSIRDYLLKNAQGVILWVTLITKDLLRHVEKGMFTFQELKKILDELPLELHGLYCRIMHDLRMSSSELDQVKARRILLWIVGASQTRLLELQELLDALAITWNLDEALQSLKDPISSNRPQVRSWNHFRRSIHELCGPFIEVIRPASRLSDELFDDFDVEPTFVVQLTHQTAKDFLATSDAQHFQVILSEAEDKVNQDKIKYMRVALPQIPTSYMPKIDAADTEPLMNVEDLAEYFEQKLLLWYVLTTLPREDCRKHISQLRKQSTAASRPSLWAFIAETQFADTDTDVVKSAENNVVGAYFWISTRAGLVTATKNMLAIISTADGWRWLSHHIVENAALLAAVEHGMLDEVQSLLRSHPDGYRFLAENASLLDRAAQTGIQDIAMCIYDKAARDPVSPGHGVPDRSSFLANVQAAKNVSIEMKADVEEVRKAIQAIMIR